MTDEQMIAWLRVEAALSVYDEEKELFNRIADRIEALQADKAKLREAGYDALVALDSARAFILKKYGSKNPAREDAIAALFAALQETGETFTHPDNV